LHSWYRFKLGNDRCGRCGIEADDGVLGLTRTDQIPKTLIAGRDVKALVGGPELPKRLTSHSTPAPQHPSRDVLGVKQPANGSGCQLRGIPFRVWQSCERPPDGRHQPHFQLFAHHRHSRAFVHQSYGKP